MIVRHDCGFSRRRSPFLGSLVCLLATLWLLGTVLPIQGYCENLRFVFLSDGRGYDEAHEINTDAINDLFSQILALSPKPAFVVFAGDTVYQGENSDGQTYNFQAWKDQDIIKQLGTAGINLYVTIGNHELYNGASLTENYYLSCQQQFQQTWSNMPDNGPDAGHQYLTYSFPSPGGDCFFAVLDSFYMDPNGPAYVSPDQSQGVDQAQLDWLNNQLAQTHASHKFVFHHFPTYLVTSCGMSPSCYNLWKILDDYKFDALFCGHEHLFSRKTIDSSVDTTWKNHVVQVITGDAGAPPEDPATVIRDWASWHINVGLWYYSVIDIKDQLVTVNTYGGNNGIYHLIDRFTIPPISPDAINSLLLEE
jgi:Calcineurin-like phosphoesterase